MAYKSLVVIDDFYHNPDAVRKHALESDWERTDGAQYAGAIAEPYIAKGALDYLGSLVGHTPVAVPGVKFGHFKRSFATDSTPSDIHFDSTMWGAIVFLSNPAYDRGGLTFWRYKQFGWEWAPSQEELESKGFKSLKEVQDEIGWKKGGDRSLWEEVIRVPMKYNRTVLFRGFLWHSHTENFGSTLENCRLVQVFGFN